VKLSIRRRSCQGCRCGPACRCRSRLERARRCPLPSTAQLGRQQRHWPTASRGLLLPAPWIQPGLRAPRPASCRTPPPGGLAAARHRDATQPQQWRGSLEVAIVSDLADLATHLRRGVVLPLRFGWDNCFPLCTDLTKAEVALRGSPGRACRGLAGIEIHETWTRSGGESPGQSAVSRIRLGRSQMVVAGSQGCARFRLLLRGRSCGTEAALPHLSFTTPHGRASCVALHQGESVASWLH